MPKRTALPPASLEELMARAAAIDGRQISELADLLGMKLGSDNTHGKGQLGVVLEQVLGASAGNRDLPDFPELDVELKTIPLDENGHVRESTFICTLNLKQIESEQWEESRVRRKLSSVLWIPVIWQAHAPMSARRVGTPLFWRPTAEQTSLLRADWQMLVGRINAQGADQLSAHDGEALQIRPKAANSRVRRQMLSAEGDLITTVPLGFYLRARFTEQVLWHSAKPVRAIKNRGEI